MKTIFWLTGQPGAGKTVLAKQLIKFLSSDKNKVFHIDGDDLREVLSNKDYSKEGRISNIKAAQHISRYLNMNDHHVVVSLVSPYRKIREEFKSANNVCEIYVHTSNIRGREHFHSDEYEPPISNFIDIDTTNISIDESIKQIISHITSNIKL